MDFGREQRSPGTNSLEYLYDQNFKLDIAFELSPDWLRRREDEDTEKPLSNLNFSKDESSSEPCFKLWSDEDPPVPKRSRTSLPANPPSSEKSSSSGEDKHNDRPMFNFSTDESSSEPCFKLWSDEDSPIPKRSRTSLLANPPSSEKSSSSGKDKDNDRPLFNFSKDEWSSKPHFRFWSDEEPPIPRRSRSSLPANPPPVEKSSSSCPYGLPIETIETSCVVDFVMPRSSVLSSRSVSFVQSEEGMQVVTEETVAHTIYEEDLPRSDIQTSNSGVQNCASCYRNTADQRDRTNSADLSAKWHTTSVPDGLNNKGLDGMMQEIIGPSRSDSTIIIRGPSKTSSSSLVGSTDRTKIVRGWKPVYGQTVVRRPSRTSQNSVRTSSEGNRKPQQPSRDSLWTTFDGASRKSGTCAQPVPGQSRSGIGRKDQELGLAQSARVCTSKPGTDAKSGNSAKSSLERLSVSTATTLNRRDPANVQSTMKSSFGGRMESATVQKLDSKKTTGNGSSGNTGDVEFLSRNSNSRLVSVGLAGYQHGLAKDSSSSERPQSAKVQNLKKCSSDVGKDGCQDVVSKWLKFQETPSTHERRQPVPNSGSSLVRTTNQSTISNRVRTQTTSSSVVRPNSQSSIENRQPRTQTTTSNPVRNPATSSSLVRPSDQSSFQSEVPQSLPSQKPEVACVTPQVRQPLRALQLDDDMSQSNLAEDGVYHISLHCVVNFVAILM